MMCDLIMMFCLSCSQLNKRTERHKNLKSWTRRNKSNSRHNSKQKQARYKNLITLHITMYAGKNWRVIIRNINKEREYFPGHWVIKRNGDMTEGCIHYSVASTLCLINVTGNNYKVRAAIFEQFPTSPPYPLLSCTAFAVRRPYIQRDELKILLTFNTMAA